MRKSVFLMAVAGIFMGFGWRADHAMKMRKMENVETVTARYVAERAGRKDFFVVDLRGAPSPERTPAAFEVFLTPAQLEGADAAARLEAAGITLFILSNSRRPGRAQRFAQALGVPYEGHAGKPKRGGFQRALARMGVTAEETAIVGDQIFTDTWGGNNAGVLTLLVHPIRFGTVFRFLRFALETPFRAGAQKGETL